jgi:hypothetical protein
MLACVAFAPQYRKFRWFSYEPFRFSGLAKPAKVL